jgi:hypothetical protein
LLPPPHCYSRDPLSLRGFTWKGQVWAFTSVRAESASDPSTITGVIAITGATGKFAAIAVPLRFVTVVRTARS